MNNIVQQIGSIAFIVMIIITCGMMIYTFLHLRTLSAALSETEVTAEKIRKNLLLTQIKAEVLQEEQLRKKKQNRIAGLIIPGLLAIKAVYDAHDIYHGIFGYRKAANDVLFGSKAEAFRRKLHG